MSDDISKGLSALLDNEASELDVRRLTKNMTDQDLDTWQRYCLIKDVVKKENTGFEFVNLLQGIRDGIADDVIDVSVSGDSPANGLSSWKHWFGGAGIAAADAREAAGG